MKVKGFRAGWTDSDVRLATYTFTLGTVAAPAFSPAGGTYTSAQVVELNTPTAGATIRYTTDGTEPTLLSKIYTAPIPINQPVTVRARAFKQDWTPSPTAVATYAFDYGTVSTPTLQPAGGDYPSARLVTISTATSGATIHYTTNGLEPSDADPTIASGGTLLIDRAMRLRAKAFKTGLPPSALVTGDYWITGAVVAGHQFTLALKADGTLWSWGKNDQGQLGIGSTTAHLCRGLRIARPMTNSFARVSSTSRWCRVRTRYCPARTPRLPALCVRI